eukprot:6397669-Prymnesium_polylepis.1
MSLVRVCTADNPNPRRAPVCRPRRATIATSVAVRGQRAPAARSNGNARLLGKRTSQAISAGGARMPHKSRR